MRSRWLKPEFFSDKKIAALGPIAALVYEALWCMADDGGTAVCDADTVKAQMFYRWSAVGVPEITEALHDLARTGRIVRYQVGDDTYCRIPTWKEHQQVHKPSKFRHPAMDKGVALPVPGECGTTTAPLPAPPPPRHLDSQTPRHPSPNGGTAEPSAIRVSKPRSSRPPLPWMGVMGAAWTVGTLPPGSATLLQPVVAAVGADETAARMRRYCEQTDPQYASVRNFVAKHAAYADDGPLVDPVSGALTEAGYRAAGGRR